MPIVNVATVVVPPMFVAIIYGVYAAKISARKVHLLDRNGKSMEAAFHSRTDGLAEKSFGDLVSFVRSKVQR